MFSSKKRHLSVSGPFTSATSYKRIFFGKTKFTAHNHCLSKPQNFEPNQIRYLPKISNRYTLHPPNIDITERFEKKISVGRAMSAIKFGVSAVTSFCIIIVRFHLSTYRAYNRAGCQSISSYANSALTFQPFHFNLLHFQLSAISTYIKRIFSANSLTDLIPPVKRSNQIIIDHH